MVGLLAVVLLGGEREAFRHAKLSSGHWRLLSFFSPNLAVLIKDVTLLINLALLVCRHKW